LGEAPDLAEDVFDARQADAVLGGQINLPNTIGELRGDLVERAEFEAAGV
jgi:hypothetical protein